MGHSVVIYERINKQLNYEGYGLFRYHPRRLPGLHDRGSANLLAGPHHRGHLHRCFRSGLDRCFRNRYHPHRSSGPWRSRCQEACSAQDPGSPAEPIGGHSTALFSFSKFKLKKEKKTFNKNFKTKKKKKKKKKKKNIKKKKKKKKKKKS